METSEELVIREIITPEVRVVFDPSHNGVSSVGERADQTAQLTVGTAIIPPTAEQSERARALADTSPEDFVSAAEGVMEQVAGFGEADYEARGSINSAYGEFIEGCRVRSSAGNFSESDASVLWGVYRLHRQQMFPASFYSGTEGPADVPAHVDVPTGDRANQPA